MLTMSWRTIISAVALLCAQIGGAAAEDWPARPVRVLVGFGAGGGTDVVARTVAEKLSEVLGQPFLVENQPGAGGTIAGGIVASAPSDGYTGVVLSAGHAVSAVMVKKVPYDPVDSFALVGMLASSTFVLIVPRNSPATDLKSLLAHVNAAKGTLRYATVGRGSGQHLIAEDLRQRTGANAQHVSFATTGEVVAALVKGDAAFAFELYQAVRGPVMAGDLRLLAVASPYRWPAAPDVPTLAESGLEDFKYGGWYGFAFPRGTPKPIVDKMHAALERVMARDDVRRSLEVTGAIATLSTATQLREIIEWDIKKLQDVAKRSGLEPK
jgi:tripartite-type tricarboxylate transporter receptor subunit TctC